MDGSVTYLLIAVGCLVAVVGLVAVVRAVRAARRRAARKLAEVVGDPFRRVDDDADALRGDPRTLGPGDVVEVRHTSYGVRGTLRCTEGTWSWTEHLLDDARGGTCWLSVEEDPELELVLWTDSPEVTVTPGPARLDVDGRGYRRDEVGRASFTASGTTGLDPTGTFRYQDYVADDGSQLSFEAYGDSGRWAVSRGESLHRTEVQIYPGSPGDADAAGRGRVG